MRDLLLRIVNRSFPVALVLAVMGYILAEAYLMLQQMHGGVHDPANDSVKWRAPLTMALIGVGLLTVMEILIYFVRRKHAPPPVLDAPPPRSDEVP